VRFLVASPLGRTRAPTYRLEPYNTFDGPGFPACRDVAKVYSPKTVEEAVSIVKDASDKGLPVRASGVSFPLSILPSAFL
jgi:L-gulonolactone oxidase